MAEEQWYSLWAGTLQERQKEERRQTRSHQPYFTRSADSFIPYPDLPISFNVSCKSLKTLERPGYEASEQVHVYLFWSLYPLPFNLNPVPSLLITWEYMYIHPAWIQDFIPLSTALIKHHPQGCIWVPTHSHTHTRNHTLTCICTCTCTSHTHTHTHLSVGDMAADHIAGLAFGGQQPHSPSEHIVDPNVLVIHSVKVSLRLIPRPSSPAFQCCTWKNGWVQHWKAGREGLTILPLPYSPLPVANVVFTYTSFLIYEGLS